jgi:hypothetical protein
LSYSLSTKQTAAVQHIAFQIIEKHIKNVHPPQLLGSRFFPLRFFFF